MDLKKLFDDDDAVSPVIGVILMVAITVILAAVIGAFVLGIGSNQEKAPQASIAFDFDTSLATTEVDITHDGGDTFNAQTLGLQGTTNCGSDNTGSDTQLTSGSIIASGCEENGDTVAVTWTASSGDSTQILAEQDWP